MKFKTLFKAVPHLWLLQSKLTWLFSVSSRFIRFKLIFPSLYDTVVGKIYMLDLHDIVLHMYCTCSMNSWIWVYCMWSPLELIIHSLIYKLTAWYATFLDLWKLNAWTASMGQMYGIEVTSLTCMFNINLH